MKREKRHRVRLGMGGGCIGLLIALSVIAALPITTQAAPYVYVANAGEGTVSVVDAATDTVTATIPVGAYTGIWPVDPVINPSGTRVYVAVHNAVVVIDATTNAVLTRITDDVQPSGGLAIDPSGTWLYVVNYTDPSSVSVVNTSSNRVSTIIFTAGRGSTHMAVSPDGTRGYVTNTIDTNEMDHCQADPYRCPLTVDVLDLTRNTWLDTIFDVGANLRGIVVDPKGILYVAQWDERTGRSTGVAVGNGYTRIPIPAGAYDVAVNPSGTTAYTVGELGFFVIDASTHTYAVTATVPADPYNESPRDRFFSIALNQSGTRAYVTKLPDGAGVSQLVVIDTATPAIIDALTIGSAPFGVAVGPDNPPFSPPPTSTPTPSATPTPTPTRVCAGDCDGNRIVTVDEIMRCVDIALGTVQPTDCPGCDADSDGQVTIDEILGAVDNALTGCPAMPTVTTTATPAGSPPPTPSPTLTPMPTEEGVCPPRPTPTEFPCDLSCMGPCVYGGITGRCRADVGPCFCDTEGPTRTATANCPTGTPTPGTATPTLALV